MSSAPAVWFPPGREVVLIPRNNRECAKRGLTLYTASSRRILGAQWAAWAWIQTLGPRTLPGRTARIDIPETAEISKALGFGRDGLHSVAAFKRRDGRSGETYVAVGSAGSLLIKIRRTGESLALEQELLAAVQRQSPLAFSAPRPVDIGSLADGRSWSAQEMVFAAPHRPSMRLSEGFESQLLAVLRSHPGLIERVHPDWVPAHGDLSPWNLRVDHRGKLWLFDWEDATVAPPGADRAYFEAATGVINRRRPMDRVDPVAAAYWADRIRHRLATGHPQWQNEIMLARLESVSGGHKS
ncbi:phosphotransferase [Microlunatus elymi]|uniref:Phosphotransferase n=1 Tax=Microlunatus elymi TaxID=2596828 RepID=A0A516PVI1_9ACTN|nr:phosphotransferase [Microlunatus elymi]QDP95173.1 phosphotransferase [Microlunatus elymi]